MPTTKALALLSALPLIFSEPVVVGTAGVVVGATLLGPAIRSILPRRMLASSEPSFINDEILDGTPDGKNLRFTLKSEPLPGSLVVFVDRARQTVSRDYTRDGRVITFAAEAAPQSGAILVAQYSR